MKSLRVEFHCHTVYSHDGHMGFDALLAAACGHVDVVCITDHDTIEGALEFQQRSIALDCNLHVVIGEERTLADGGHLIGLFLKEPISSKSFDDAVKEIREQGGICVLPHPFRHKDGILSEVRPPLDGVSGFEIFNPKCSFDENKMANALSAAGLLPVGGSDAHYASDLGECINLIPCVGSPITSVESFFRTRVPYTVIGISQKPGEHGRKYASVYYRLKPFFRVPRPLVPAAQALYRSYRNNLISRKSKQMETKYVSG